jgi:hypothetical protein
MTEFKDPNQLDMFAGVLLTPEQQQQVDNYIIQSKQKHYLSGK